MTRGLFYKHKQYVCISIEVEDHNAGVTLQGIEDALRIP